MSLLSINRGKDRHVIKIANGIVKIGLSSIGELTTYHSSWIRRYFSYLIVLVKMNDGEFSMSVFECSPVTTTYEGLFLNMLH